MILPFPETTQSQPVRLTMSRDVVRLETERTVQFIDITELVAERVRRSGVSDGMACLFTLHTTTAITIQEDEPFLLEDLESQLERVAPKAATYRHNDLEARRRRPWVPMLADERENGAAHARAMMLGPSETVHIEHGRLVLGEWQRIFWVELDGPRPRCLSVLILGGSARSDEEQAHDATTTS